MPLDGKRHNDRNAHNFLQAVQLLQGPYFLSLHAGTTTMLELRPLIAALLTLLKSRAQGIRLSIDVLSGAD